MKYHVVHDVIDSGCYIFNVYLFLFQHLLPLNIISSSSIKVIYNSIDFKESTNFGYTAEYKFHNEETCGTRRISTRIGNLIIFSPCDNG